MNNEDWESRLKEEFGGIPVIKPQPVVPTIQPKKSGGYFLFMLSFLMTGLLVFALYYKKPKLFSFIQEIKWSAETVVEKDKKVDLGNIWSELKDLKAGQEKFEKQLSDVDRRVEVQGERIILMGTIINDNAEGVKRGDRDPLYLNGDWTLPRGPRYLRTDPKDQPFINDHIKKK